MSARLIRKSAASSGPRRDDRDERRDASRVELRARTVLELPQRVALAETAAVGPVLAHREIGIGDRDDPRRERDLLTGETARVAAAIPTLVVPRHHLGDRGLDLPADDPLAFERMLSDAEALALGQGAGLRQDPLADAELPDVVQERPVDDGAPRPFAELQLGRDPQR